MQRIQSRRSLWLGVAAAVAIVLTGSLSSLQSAGTLDIYWIDVEAAPRR